VLYSRISDIFSVHNLDRDGKFEIPGEKKQVAELKTLTGERV
jgi:hypothetical protein